MKVSKKRYLLEKAAKAAGYDVMWCDSHDIGHPHVYIVPLPEEVQHFVFNEYPYNEWDPLTDYSDTFKLMVRLIELGYPPDRILPTVPKKLKDDQCKEIARRIVELAAAIGEEM